MNIFLQDGDGYFKFPKAYCVSFFLLDFLNFWFFFLFQNVDASPEDLDVIVKRFILLETPRKILGARVLPQVCEERKN